ncbi:hypothetical protein [Mycobacterium lepromatosis]|nr:hypothetical protein [Mycobacterium lepromatosis]
MFWTRDVGGEHGTMHAGVVDAGKYASPYAPIRVVTFARCRLSKVT